MADIPKQRRALSLLKPYLGDRAFYKRVLAVSVPIIIQNGITNFVSLLDNIMVGQVGTAQMSGVSIVNGLLFVFNLCIFGACSGAGIFTAQFFGSQNHKGVRHTFRFKLLICLALSLGAVVLFWFGGQGLIGLYLRGEGDPHTAALCQAYGLIYLRVMLLGLLPFSLCNAYASTLRETGQALVPMIAGVCAVLVNLTLNYILIFGHFGAPQMGVRGAAIATVVSRYVELGIVAVWTHLNPVRNPFIQGAYNNFAIPAPLLRNILRKGLPLLANEALWAAGTAVMNQCYSTCSLDVVPAMNISSTIWNLTSVVFLSLGTCVGILMGQMMGAGAEESEVREENRKLLALAAASGVVFGLVLALLSGLFPLIYNTTSQVRLLATQLILISAAIMPFNSYVNAIYFTMRSGGQTGVTFLFDSGFVWIVCVPLAFVLSRFTSIPILPLYALCQGVEIVKSFVGAWLIRQGKWIRNLTA